MRRCPAIILAERRIAKVPGRIKFLIVSITTMKGMRRPGVPWGIRWAKIFAVLFSQPNSIRAPHMGRAKDMVNTM